MTARSTHGLSSQARNLHWLLTNLVEEVPGLLSVAVVSSDGVLLLSSDSAAAQAPKAPEAPAEPGTQARGGGRGPKGTVGDLATIVSGLGSLTVGAAKLMDGGRVRQTMVAMEEGSLFVMAISDGSLLGAHATPDCDMSVVAYHMALFVGRAGHVLTPELRGELRRSMDSAAAGERVPGSRRPPQKEQLAGRPAGGAK
ncbi:roadblock/LC7 domain-containing protein [Streptomyces sp. NPDC050560]|uniref:roadblock/LC7 domain-containing protein n=1 Tax=Streptomyces sp. NPDC050560 TaxID=3365630 RepID=UPI0037B76106